MLVARQNVNHPLAKSRSLKLQPTRGNKPLSFARYQEKLRVRISLQTLTITKKINKKNIYKNQNKKKKNIFLGEISNQIFKQKFGNKYFTQRNTKVNKGFALATTTQQNSTADAMSRPSARLENNTAARALPSPPSPCVRTAMANDAIPNFTMPRPFPWPHVGCVNL